MRPQTTEILCIKWDNCIDEKGGGQTWECGVNDIGPDLPQAPEYEGAETPAQQERR